MYRLVLVGVLRPPKVILNVKKAQTPATITRTRVLYYITSVIDDSGFYFSVKSSLQGSVTS